MIGVDPVGLSPLGMAFGKKKQTGGPQGNSGRFHRVTVRKAIMGRVDVQKVSIERLTLN